MEETRDRDVGIGRHGNRPHKEEFLHSKMAKQLHVHTPHSHPTPDEAHSAEQVEGYLETVRGRGTCAVRTGGGDG